MTHFREQTRSRSPDDRYRERNKRPDNREEKEERFRRDDRRGDDRRPGRSDERTEDVRPKFDPRARERKSRSVFISVVHCFISAYSPRFLI